MRRVLAGSLAALLLLACPGPAAWAQVAAVRTAAPVPVAALGASAAGLRAPSLGPALTAPSLTLPAPALLPAAQAAALLAPALRAQAASVQAVAAQARPLTKALARTAAVAAPFVAAARETSGGAAGAHSAGRGLEAALTGLRSAPEAAVAAVPDADPRNGILPGGNAGLLHDHDHGPEHRHEAVEPEAPPAPVPPAARRAFAFYAGGVSAVKVGIETLNLVVPILLLTHYGAATVLGALFISAQVAGLAAGALAGPLIDRFGARPALAAAAALQTAAIGVVPVSLLLGAPVTLPVLFGLFALNGALSGVFDIARRAALPGILGSDERTLRRYNAKLYIAREVAAMGAVFGAGWLLEKVGALATLSLHPAAYLAAAAAFVVLARMRLSAAAPSPSVPAPAGEVSRWGEFTEGMRLVLKDPALRLAALVNVPVIALHNLFHAMLAAVYATSVLGSPALAAVMIGAWNAGELAAAFYLDRRGEESGGAAWLRYAALMGLAGWALFAFPSIWVAAPVSFLLATATLGNEIGLASFFQSAAPKGREGAVTGFVYSAATAVAMGLMLAAGWMFDAFGALPGFAVLAGALTAVSALYLLASKRLKR